jgi:hypothetical protein
MSSEKEREPETAQVLIRALHVYREYLGKHRAPESAPESFYKDITPFLRGIDKQMLMYLLVDFQMHYTLTLDKSDVGSDDDPPKYKASADPIVPLKPIRSGHFINVMIVVKDGEKRQYHHMLCFHSSEKIRDAPDAPDKPTCRLAYMYLPLDDKKRKAIYDASVEALKPIVTVSKDGVPEDYLNKVNVTFKHVGYIYPFCQILQSHFRKIHQLLTSESESESESFKKDVVPFGEALNKIRPLGEGLSMYDIFHYLLEFWEQINKDALDAVLVPLLPKRNEGQYVGVQSIAERLKEVHHGKDKGKASDVGDAVQKEIFDDKNKEMWIWATGKKKKKKKDLVVRVEEFQQTLKDASDKGPDASPKAGTDDGTGDLYGEDAEGTAGRDGRPHPQRSDVWRDEIHVVDQSVYVKNAVVSTVLGAFVAAMFTW